MRSILLTCCKTVTGKNWAVIRLPSTVTSKFKPHPATKSSPLISAESIFFNIKDLYFFFINYNVFR